jgi:signal peptidase II
MLITAVAVLTLDQLTKAWVSANMVSHDIRPVIVGFVRLRYTENTGAAFGLFQGWTGVLSVAAVAIIAAIVLSAPRVGGGTWPAMLAMGLVLGGAIGNLLDRLTLGYVRDFIEVYGPHIEWQATRYTFPIFNVADSAITVGVLLIMALLLFGKSDARPSEARPAPVYRKRAPSPWFRGLDQEQ